MVRKQRVDKLAEHLTSKLAVFVEAARNPEDREVGQSFKVRLFQEMSANNVLTRRRKSVGLKQKS